MLRFWHGQGIKFIELIYLIDLVPTERMKVNGIIIIHLWMKVWQELGIDSFDVKINHSMTFQLNKLSKLVNPSSAYCFHESLLATVVPSSQPLWISLV